MPYRTPAPTPFDASSILARDCAAAASRHARRVTFALLAFGVGVATFACILHASWSHRPVGHAHVEPLRGQARLTWFVRAVPASLSFYGGEYCSWDGKDAECCELQRGTPFQPIRTNTSCGVPQ
jgi:hypothetical protein